MCVQLEGGLKTGNGLCVVMLSPISGSQPNVQIGGLWMPFQKMQVFIESHFVFRKAKSHIRQQKMRSLGVGRFLRLVACRNRYATSRWPSAV